MSKSQWVCPNCNKGINVRGTSVRTPEHPNSDTFICGECFIFFNNEEGWMRTV